MEQNGSVQTVTRRISERLAERIGHHSYDMWFGDTTKLQVEGSCVQVATDSRFVAEWIDGHFRDEITGAARDTLGNLAKIDLRVAPDLVSGDTAMAPTTGVRRRPGNGSGRAPSGRGANGTMASMRRFEDFVVGPSNRLAFTAAQRIAAGSAESTSPLYLHGECGVGKTHLLQGIAHAVSRSGGATARYVTAEQFTNEYINAVRTNSIDRFRRRARKVDLLAIDDVHFLANKTATQREFLHTIDAIDLSGSRLVLASDDHPLRLGFTQALSSRFVAGMVARIERPDRETRITLIHRLAAARGLRVAAVAADRIAERCVGSVRELQGAINKLAAVRLVGGRGNDTNESNGVNGRQQADIGLVLVEQLFSDGTWRPRKPLHVNTVIDTVCNRLVVDRADLMGTGRHRRVVAARGLVAYLARSMTTLSYPEIAQALGRKHHSTIHTAVGRMNRQLTDRIRVEVGEQGESVCVCELVDQLRHQILGVGTGRRGAGA
jgi:chromosomal replication initiator protein